jgi:hypothetical protein
MTHNEKELNKMKTLNHEQYINFIKKTIKDEGWKIADTANKLALEMKAITTSQYSEAARIVVSAYLAN